MFVVSVVQLIKIGDISMQQSGFALSSSDTPAEEMMDVDEVHLPDGTEQPSQVLDRQEERVLVRESTAGFAGGLVFFE
jgi:proteasome activator subunit 4